MIKLINEPAWIGGGLWFVIPKDLQPIMRDYLRSKLHEVESPLDRLAYEQELTDAAMLEDYTNTINTQGSYGRFVIYASNGEWRCGDRAGIHSRDLEAAQQEIIASIFEYKISKLEQVPQ